ncbi:MULTISPECIES: TetR family transcriptional regulator C-terminal domain-containing protein [unclassified Roseitalea]|uniref:TetR family transcriptional regulator C-terminal domain-containing protein n=1 Tax=unclassified Roseitalea TaxID=2639107 RepID=UPI00273FBD5F|nr:MULTISPECIES: TetR family transcriptional regulator C-terminal domain-containing protein [unclassified Roseitalea]
MAAGAAQARSGSRSRIQTENRALITQAALDVFSTDGYRGATVDRIAERAGMSKTNLLYYYPSKEDIYRTVIEQTVEDWLRPFAQIDPDGEPIEELRRYITVKLKMSETSPEASRLFANEIQRGAPLVMEFLTTRLKALVDEKAAVIGTWIDQGRLAPVDPYHLIFAIWATTQHYADFEAQIGALLGSQAKGPGFSEQASHAVLSILLNGIRPR